MTSLILLAIFIFSGCSKEDDPGTEIPYQPIDLHLFSAGMKGFNLQGKFDYTWSDTGFPEKEFQIVSELGFNFVRLPLDYLTYTEWDNWNAFDETAMAEIDKAIEWGEKYDVHVCINLHRAPGYSVNTSGPIPSDQQVSLWSDQGAQETFVNHWEFFAERYRDIPAGRLSFNLLNEPSNVDETVYTSIMKRAIDRIHAHNPNRVVFVDGLNYANDLVPGLKNARNVIQALHAYEPFTLTHYKAGWVNGSDAWPVPEWPMIDVSNYLYGPWKPEFRSSLIIEGDFKQNTEIIVNVRQVSIESALEIRLDDAVVYTKSFLCGPDPGEDFTEIIETQWGYQNISNKDYAVVLPADGSTISFSNSAGDWMTYNRITIKSETREFTIIPGENSWGSEQRTLLLGRDGAVTDPSGNSLILSNMHEKLQTAQDENIPVMIQEFGVHNQTPHDVTLEFLGDLVPIFDEFKVGYALWNLEGSFGIINSGRTDCNYDSFEGELLDRQMFEILVVP